MLSWRSPAERRSLEAIVVDTLGPAAMVLGILLAIFAVADSWLYPAPAGPRIAIADGIAAVVFLGTAALFWLKRIPPRLANPTGAMLAILVALNVVHDIWLLEGREPSEPIYLVLVLVGAASLILSTAWLVAVIGVTAAGWLAATAAYPTPSDVQFGFALFATAVLALLIHEVRVHNYLRAENLRRREAERAEELQARETTLQEVVRALQESEDRYRRLVEQAPDAFLVLSERRVLYVNTAGIRLFGANSSADIVGRDPLDLVHPDDRQTVLERNEQIERHGAATTFTPIRIMRFDGEFVDVETFGQPILYMGKPADQTIVRDITERKRAEQERLRSATQAAEIARLKEMDRVKTQFVNTISHELRTPLTPVKVQLHILKKGIGTKETQAKAIDVIDRNFARLSGLVDELLEVARIQAGNLKLSRAFVDMAPVVHQALESFEDVAKQGGVKLTWTVEPDLSVEADAKRLTQVMYNLLGNAFKFTTRGDTVHVDARRADEHVVVRVKDSGSGLTQDDIARLFEPFSQVHNTMERTNAGTGLGLYICRGIIEGHEGEIWAESEGLGKGATFAFRIPLDKAPRSEASAPAASGS